VRAKRYSFLYYIPIAKLLLVAPELMSLFSVAYG